MNLLPNNKIKENIAKLIIFLIIAYFVNTNNPQINETLHILFRILFPYINS